jgi:hypothetical protein
VRAVSAVDPRDSERLSTFTAAVEPGELVQLRVNRFEASLVSRHWRLARDLERDVISQGTFQLFASRSAPVAGHQLLADPMLMLAILMTASPEDFVFDYRHGRRGRSA